MTSQNHSTHPVTPVLVHIGGDDSFRSLWEMHRASHAAAKLHRISIILEGWDETEESAEKTLARVELWLKNSRLPPVVVEIPEHEV